MMCVQSEPSGCSDLIDRSGVVALRVFALARRAAVGGPGHAPLSIRRP